MRARALVLLVVAVVGSVAAGCGSTPAPTPAPSVAPATTPSASPTGGGAPVATQAPSFSAATPTLSSAFAPLEGTWSGSPATEPSDQVTIAFRACEDGGVCGAGKWTHTDSYCAFTLGHTATDEGAFVFTVESREGMQCGWGGPDIGTTFRVEPAPDGTLDLRHSPGMPWVTLSRSQAPSS